MKKPVSSVKQKRERVGERIERVYEGPEVLGPLLSGSGCELSVDEVVEEFVCALEEGSVQGEIIPLLWEMEPRFADAGVARRTFGNLFGLWDSVAKELGVGGEVALGDLDPSAPVSDRVVDRVWGKLDSLDERAWRRARDRFDNHQGDVAAFVFERLADQDGVVVETALDLAFESWWILEDVRGAAGVPRASRVVLEGAFDAEDGGGESEPGLAGLATAVLWEQAADEERPLPEVGIGVAERVLKAVRWGLSPRVGGVVSSGGERSGEDGAGNGEGGSGAGDGGGGAGDGG